MRPFNFGYTALLLRQKDMALCFSSLYCYSQFNCVSAIIKPPVPLLDIAFGYKNNMQAQQVFLALLLLLIITIIVKIIIMIMLKGN